MTFDRDIVITGAGASGLAAAIEALRTDASLSVALLDREDRVGKKILATGNGRCNLSNTGVGPDAYSGNAERYAGVQKRYGNAPAFFGSMGLLTWTDRDGRIYPYSNQASSVLNALRREAAALGAEEMCGFEVSSVSRAGEGFRLVSRDGRTLTARKIIIACGTPAGSRTDRNTGLYASLEKLGHRMNGFRGALAPLSTDPAAVKSLKGIRARADVTLKDRNGNEKARSTGEVQFGDGYLGGICVMDISYMAKAGDFLSLDLCPDLGEDELEKWLGSATGNMQDKLEGLLPKALGAYVCRTSGIRTGQNINKITKCIKHLEFPVTKEADIARAQVCSGGLDPSGVNGDTLQSMVCPGLFFCGEILGVTGRCGGFNLDFAWASGRCCGRSAAEG